MQKKPEILAVVYLNNETDDRIILSKLSVKTKKRFIISKESTDLDGKVYNTSKNFSMDQAYNGDVKKWLDKLTKNVPEEQMTWVDPEAYMIDHCKKRFKVLVY